jgi:hypothetical protein
MILQNGRQSPSNWTIPDNPGQPDRKNQEEQSGHVGAAQDSKNSQDTQGQSGAARGTKDRKDPQGP